MAPETVNCEDSARAAPTRLSQPSQKSFAMVLDILRRLCRYKQKFHASKFTGVKKLSFQVLPSLCRSKLSQSCPMWGAYRYWDGKGSISQIYSVIACQAGGSAFRLLTDIRQILLDRLLLSNQRYTISCTQLQLSCLVH